MWIYFLIGASVTKAQPPFGDQAIFTLVLHKLGGNGNGKPNFGFGKNGDLNIKAYILNI